MCLLGSKARNEPLGGLRRLAAVGQRAFENIDNTAHGDVVGDLDGIDTT